MKTNDRLTSSGCVEAQRKCCHVEQMFHSLVINPFEHSLNGPKFLISVRSCLSIRNMNHEI